MLFCRRRRHDGSAGDAVRHGRPAWHDGRPAVRRDGADGHDGSTARHDAAAGEHAAGVRAPAVEKLREKLASASTRCGFNVQGMMGIRPQQVGMQQPQGMYGMVGQGQQGMGQMGMMGGQQQFGMGAQPGMLPQQVSCLVCAQCRIIRRPPTWF